MKKWQAHMLRPVQMTKVTLLDSLLQELCWACKICLDGFQELHKHSTGGHEREEVEPPAPAGDVRDLCKFLQKRMEGGNKRETTNLRELAYVRRRAVAGMSTRSISSRLIAVWFLPITSLRIFHVSLVFFIFFCRLLSTWIFF